MINIIGVNKNLMNKNSRLGYLDTAKGVGILLVVLGHIYNGTRFERWISSFHMPLFFIISGFLFNYKSYDDKNIKCFVKKRFRKIIIPYIIFSLINITIKLIFGGFIIGEFIKDIFRICIGQSIWALWFLPALFIAEIMFMFIVRYIRKKYIRIGTILAIFVLAIFIKFSNYNIFTLVIARAFISLNFIALGYYSFNFISKVNLSFISIIILFVINIFLSQLNINVDLWSLTFGNISLYILCSILGSISLILFLKRRKEIDILYYFGSNSLIIMSTHQAIMLIAQSYNYINEIGVFLIVIISEFILIESTNKIKKILNNNRRAIEN